MTETYLFWTALWTITFNVMAVKSILLAKSNERASYWHSFFACVFGVISMIVICG